MKGSYLVLGANLGSGMLPLISSWNSSVVEKTPIIANLLVRIFCIIIFYPFVDLFAQFFPKLCFNGTSSGALSPYFESYSCLL